MLILLPPPRHGVLPMIRFYWLEPGVLAGCSRPGARPGRHTPAGEEIAADLATLRGHGIGALLSLTETSLPTEATPARPRRPRAPRRDRAP